MSATTPKLGSAEAARLQAYWPAVSRLLPRLPRPMIVTLDAAFVDDEPVWKKLIGWNHPKNGVRRALRVAFALDAAIGVLKNHAAELSVTSLQLCRHGVVLGRSKLRPQEAVDRLVRETRLPAEIAEKIWMSLHGLLVDGALDGTGLWTDVGDPRHVVVRFPSVVNHAA